MKKSKSKTKTKTSIDICVDKIMERMQENNIEIAQRAVRNFVKDEKEKRKNKYLRNTKLLLRHYNEFQAHANNSITCMKDLKNFEDYLPVETNFNNFDEDVYISSIIRSKTRTILILSHIDCHLKQLEKLAIKKGIFHKYQMLHDHYINGKTQERIASQNDCYTAQVSKWINEMIIILNKLLFGIDTINDYFEI